MMACLEAKVWLNFLPAHTSQVFQPLDLGPFSVLKRAYRKHLRQACASSLTMAPKKPEFLESWNLARKEAITPGHIATGWKATGIYPGDPLKPLNSRLARQREQDGPEGATWSVPHPTEDPLLSETSAMAVTTPKSSRQVHDIYQELFVVDTVYNNATLRQVFRKTGKALDQATAEISSLKHERDQLAAALDRQKPQKHQKVQPTAQGRFVTILDVLKVKAEIATSGSEGATVTTRSPSIETESSGEESDSTIEEVFTVS